MVPKGVQRQCQMITKMSRHCCIYAILRIGASYGAEGMWGF